MGSLGGIEHFAMYTIPPGEWDWWETQTTPDEEMVAEKKLAEDEHLKATPWLFAPEVLEAKETIETLKELRRGANANFDFEMSAKRTKEISEAERRLTKLIKKAKRAYKRASKSIGGAAESS